MSFRIEDILKKTHSDFVLENSLNPTWSPSSVSILHQTLLHPVFSPSNSDYNGKIYRDSFCEKMYYPFTSMDAYAEKGLSAQYPPIYTTHSRMWPLYTPNSQSFVYQNYTKRKGGQVRFTASQTEALEDRFKMHKYLSPEDRRILADTLNLTDRQVKTWFQNRRAKWRRCNNQSHTRMPVDVGLEENIYKKRIVLKK